MHAWHGADAADAFTQLKHTMRCMLLVLVGVLSASVPPRSAHYAVRQQGAQGGAWSPLFVYTSEASTDAARCGYMNNTRGWTASWVHVTLPAAATAVTPKVTGRRWC